MGFNVTWNEVDILPEAYLQQFWHKYRNSHFILLW